MATKTIKASGGDFTSLSAWFSSLPATLTEPEIAEVDAFALDDVLLLTGKTQSSANYIEIRAASGQRHNGVKGVGARLLNSAALTSTLRIDMPFVRVRGLEIPLPFGSTQSALLVMSGANVSGSDVIIDGCLAHDSATNTSYYTVSATLLANLNLTFVNNIVCGGRRSADFRSIASLKEYNNIYWRRNNALGVLREATAVSYNNYSGSAVSGSECFWTAGAAPTGSHNVSSDASATTDTPSGSINSVSGASIFVSVTSGSEDFKPLNGTTVLHNAGTTVASVTTDAAGVARPQDLAYDIGAFEFVESAGPTDATAPSATITGTATLAPGAATGSAGGVSATAPAANLTGTASLTPGAATGGTSGSFASEIMVNNTGSLLASIAVLWEWRKGSGIGVAPTSVTYGSGTTSAAGILTASGLPIGAGELLVATPDYTSVYYQRGTVS